MREHLQRIASSDPQIRRNELLAILHTLGYPYTLYQDQIAGQQVENIVVRFHQQEHEPRLVLGTHYDSVSGSTGANDNGAGVCILLALLETYKHSPPLLPLDIVFFDLEEQDCLGSQAYIERFSRTSVLAMINLDICGVGNTLFCAPEKHTKTGVLAQPLQKVIQDPSVPCQVLPLLPPGDDTSFEKAGIPNISLCIIPDTDIAVFTESMREMQQGKRPRRRPAILETFHHGPRDTLEVIEDEAMQQVLYWVTNLVEHIVAAEHSDL